MGAGGGRRTGVILIVLILIVLVIGLGAVFLISSSGLLGGGGAPAVPGAGVADGGDVELPTPTPPPVINIIIANRDIPRGARLSEQDVTILAWPEIAEAPLPAEALIVGREEGSPGLEQVNDRIARVDILKGQPISNFMLTPGDEPTSLGDTGSDAALLIPSGQVAMSLPITNKHGLVAYALRQGDHVDVMMSFRLTDVDEEFQTGLPNEGIIVSSTADFPINSFRYVLGRTTSSPLGDSVVLVIPSETTARPRQSTQLTVDNAIVLRVGDWPFTDINQPIVITPAPEPTVDPAQPTAIPPEQGGPPPDQPTPTPTPIPAPTSVTLVMSRQDALVMKYALETGAYIDLVLRSALDDEVQNVTTDTVTLDYILNFYGVDVPPRLPVSHEPRINLLTVTSNIGAGSDLLGSVLPPGIEAVPPSQ